jgi:hypothetical protein
MMDNMGYEAADFWHQQQLLEQQEQIESEMDFAAFMEIITRRIKSKARRNQLIKLYLGENHGITENFGDC